jgi:signal peptidase I
MPATRGGARWLRPAVQLVAGGALLVAASTLFWTRGPTLIGWQTRVVSSGSMAPTLEPGDLAVLAPIVGSRSVAVGDVVQVRDADLPSGYYLHRVVRVLPDGRVVTRGEANPGEDAPVAAARVDGTLALVAAPGRHRRLRRTAAAGGPCRGGRGAAGPPPWPARSWPLRARPATRCDESSTLGQSAGQSAGPHRGRPAHFRGNPHAARLG